MASDNMGVASGPPPTSLADLEAVIERGLTSFIEVGNALVKIRDGRLYLPANGGKHTDFDTYCRERWGWGRTRAEQMITGAKVARDLAAVTNVTPTNEAQVRELARAPEPERPVVWKTVTERATKEQRQVTAADVRKEVKARTGGGESSGRGRSRTKLTDDQLAFVNGLFDKGIRGRPEIIKRVQREFGIEVGQHVIQLAQARWDERQAVLAEQSSAPKKGKGPSESGKRQRQLYDERQTNAERGTTALWKLQVAIAKAAKEVEWFPMPESLDWSDEDVQFKIEELAEDLDRLLTWTENAVRVVDANMNELSRQRRYQKLKNVVNDPSSKQQERETAAVKIERMRQRDNAKRLDSGQN